MPDRRAIPNRTRSHSRADFRQLPADTLGALASQRFLVQPTLSPIYTTMSDIVPGIHNLDELRTFVKTKLCEKENLLIEQSKFAQLPLLKQGKLCGYQFSVQGPRQVRLGAVWASDHNDIYFYDTRGHRYYKVHLPEPVTLTERN